MTRFGTNRIASAAVALSILASAAGAEPPRDAATRAWLDAPLGYLLRTDAEFGVDVAIVLRAVGQLTGDRRASEIAEIRRLGFSERQIGRLAALLTADLPLLSPARAPVERLPPGPLPPRPRPADRLTLDGRRALASTCVERAAACELGPGCTAWATDREATGLDLTHQAAWLMFARWRSCPLAIDVEALQVWLAGRLLGELAIENSYSETHLERVALLGQLGYGDRLEPDWIRTILDARSPEGCWGGAAGEPCHPHPTAIALWALAHAERAGRWPTDRPK